MTPVGRPATPAATFVAPADRPDRDDPIRWTCPASRAAVARGNKRTVLARGANRTAVAPGANRTAVARGDKRTDVAPGANRTALAARTSLAARRSRTSRTAFATLATRTALAALTGLVVPAAVATAPAAATTTTPGHTPPHTTNPRRGTGSWAATGDLSRIVPTRCPLPGCTEMVSEPLSQAVLAEVAPDAATVDQALDRNAAQTGLSTWVRIWQARAAGEQAADVAVGFHDVAQSVAMVGHLTALVGQRLGPGSTFAVPAVPGGRGFRIPEVLAAGQPQGSSPTPTGTAPAGGTSANAGQATTLGATGPGQTVVIVLRLGTEVAVVSVDATGNRPGAMAIATAQATALAQDQYRLVAAAVPLSTTGRLPVLAVVAVGLAGLLVSAAEATRRRLRTPAGGSRPA